MKTDRMSESVQYGEQYDREDSSGPGTRMQTTSTVVLICPNENHRANLVRSIVAQRATVLAEFNVYPSHAHISPLLEMDCDAFVIDIDTDAELGLELVETICTRKPSATVMVYSEVQNPERLMASMRAGAREFLVGTIQPMVLRDALVRAAVRRTEFSVKRTMGKVMAFWGAKGGSGVTTLAANFAIALKNETGGEVALVDLNPYLGDVSVLLGLTPKFTVADALVNPKRVDQEFVSTLVTEHRSGISVIAAPDTYDTSLSVENRAVGKLLDVVRGRYPFVVIDAGPGLGASIEPLFQMATTIYLVTQLDIPSLRNAQRLIAYIKRLAEPQLELVLNRYDPKRSEFDEDRVAKALGVPPQWKVPNDYAAVCRSSNTGAPLIAEKSAVANTIKSMARAASGKPVQPEKKKGLGLFS